MSSFTPRDKRPITTRELCIFAMLGAIMFISKILMEFLPNVHLLGALTIAYTLTYRSKALIPIYVYVFLNGLFAGFSLWWMPYLYIWTILWGVTMLLPKNMPDKVSFILYPLLCALHGILFGTLYAPAQAIMFGLDFNGMIAWIIAGLTFDVVHMIGNFAVGFLILPINKILNKIKSL